MATFAALVVATIAAFFITQHLKSTTPLLLPISRPAPFADIGDGCVRQTSITFLLLHHSDSVSVYVVDSTNGNIVRTVASGVEMNIPTHRQPRVRRTFSWAGHEDNGQLAPDGSYYFQISLRNQSRKVDLTQYPIVVDNVPPHLAVTSVSPSQLPAPGGVPATVHFTGSGGRRGRLIIYRTGPTGAAQAVDARLIPFERPDSQHAYKKTWDGLIHGRPAPAGTYVMTLKVASPACVTGTFPAYLPPQVGTTPHAGVTISYLTGEPPLAPVPAGADAVVGISSAGRPYQWALRRLGTKPTRHNQPLESGSATAPGLRVRLPGRSAGLYELAIRSGAHRTQVPIVARASAGSHNVLVVLPALTWQGQNPVDDNGGGFPDTLAGGGPITLERPLAYGLPSDFGGEAALLAYLDHAGLPYDLTTDVALADGSGPKLAGHSGIVFAGPEVWLPAALAPELKSYVEQGGRVLSLGTGSLQRTAVVKEAVTGAPTSFEALDPSPAAATDVLGAKPGPVRGNAESIVVIRDRLGIFKGTSGTFAGFGSFEPIAVAPPATIASAAGTTAQTASIVGYRLVSGIVVEVGLPAFTRSLAHNVDTQELVRRLWTILSG